MKDLHGTEVTVIYGLCAAPKIRIIHKQLSALFACSVATMFQYFTCMGNIVQIKFVILEISIQLINKITYIYIFLTIVRSSEL